MDHRQMNKPVTRFRLLGLCTPKHLPVSAGMVMCFFTFFPTLDAPHVSRRLKPQSDLTSELFFMSTIHCIAEEWKSEKRVGVLSVITSVHTVNTVF